MRILEAFGEPIADGGQEAFVFGVIEKMDLTDMEIDCLTSYDIRSERYNDLVESKGGKIYSLDLPFTPGKSRNNIASPFRKFLKTHFYDVVHIHSGSISVLTIMASVADKAGVKKVIVHSHATGDRDSVKHRVLRYLASLSMRKHVDVYCACSRSAADWKYEPRYAANALIIRNGIDTNKFKYEPLKRNQMRKMLGCTENDYVIGHVGRFTNEKNHIFLLKLLKIIIKKDVHTRLLLVGTGDEFSKIVKIASKNGLKEKVIFTGSVTNVEDYYQAMDVFILPSLYEGLGIVAVEAQCCGLPVILSDRVPEDVTLTNKVVRLSLNDSLKKWKKAICAFRNAERTDNSKVVKKIGFDINKTASEIRSLYL